MKIFFDILRYLIYCIGKIADFDYTIEKKKDNKKNLNKKAKKLKKFNYHHTGKQYQNNQ